MRRIGDPGSTSALGGALRQQAITLADLVADLTQVANRAERAGRPDATTRERELLERTARELDAVGAALQSYTATVLAGAARTRELATEAARADLVVDGSLVLEAPGPSRVDPTVRLRARERLQELLNRVTAAEGKELGRIARELERSGPALATVSERSRLGS
ncbi:hypothetical protein [Intrasporangium calvum]|uniref:Uncharacterized protein n=1 Tax=Intrasporangium calvum (strain ATCC 23552 / DSM 43043 / JCM 3097 / NBRC 12989 / NCIMB 10167 / NRRL B-3866 / 7 KIP) TaxID=710696 RepID=E6S757_INTC7|nr:hypothetical protein [Intrasporangium calvum]ADU48991.1 hypothetical protein Intca_2484 [Intrasporangium calvum DSM 43043]